MKRLRELIESKRISIKVDTTSYNYTILNLLSLIYAYIDDYGCAFQYENKHAIASIILQILQN